MLQHFPCIVLSMHVLPGRQDAAPRREHMHMYCAIGVEHIAPCRDLMTKSNMFGTSNLSCCLQPTKSYRVKVHVLLLLSSLSLRIRRRVAVLHPLPVIVSGSLASAGCPPVAGQSGLLVARGFAILPGISLYGWISPTGKRSVSMTSS